MQESNPRAIKSASRTSIAGEIVFAEEVAVKPLPVSSLESVVRAKCVDKVISHRDRQADRQTDRQADRQTDRPTGRQTDKTRQGQDKR